MGSATGLDPKPMLERTTPAAKSGKGKAQAEQAAKSPADCEGANRNVVASKKFASHSSMSSEALRLLPQLFNKALAKDSELNS